MKDQELILALTLQKAANIGDITAKKLIKHCGSIEAIYEEKQSNLLKIDGIGRTLVKEIFNPAHKGHAIAELNFIKKNKIKCHYYLDESYPEKLKYCIDGPILLFQSGNITIKNQPVLSIVGSRRISPQGISFCENLVEQLAVYNPIIVSGFAYGTDITAQKAAMNQNLQTIACLAHGLNQIYPRTHMKYVKKVKEHGGFITDFCSTDDFERTNFLKRNRIIAGISEATIIIESAEKGGSLITADIARSYDREVFAVPGRVYDLQSIGCNNLIKFQCAHILTNPADIPYILNWDSCAQGNGQQQSLFPDLNTEEKKLHDYLKEEGLSTLDDLAKRTQIPSYKAISILLNLELKGLIRPLPGKRFEPI